MNPSDTSQMYDSLCSSVRHQNYDHVNTMVSLVRNEQIIMTAQSLQCSA